MSNPLRVALERRDRLTAVEMAVIEQLVSSPVPVAAGTDMVREGERPGHSTLMISGFSARYTMLSDGKRQISAVHVPGDFVDLHSLLLDPMDHSVVALTDCHTVEVPHLRLREISETHPHLTRMLWTLTVIDGAIFRQWLVASGHLPAVGQISHFFCELWTRLSVVRLTEAHSFDLPISQADLGDAMGLSTVHVNRCLMSLRRNGVLEWSAGRVTILDWNELQLLAQFDAGYLNLTQRAR
jgi:CRP-like cAMP-binding protein